MRPGTVWALGGVAALFGLAAWVRRTRASSSEAEALEGEFHAVYDRLRTQEARATPVLVLFGDSLILLHGAQRRELTASAPPTRIIQAAAHAPVAIFAMLHELSEQAELTLAARTRLSELRAACASAVQALDQLEASSRRDCAQVIERSQGFIDATLSQAYANAAALEQFATEIGPLLLALIDHATQLELEALHTATEQALVQLDTEQLRELEVIVTGVHQARTRSLGLQYFQARFGEAAGEERRVAYAEAAADPEEARALVGTRRLDRAIARAFFGDAKRLQRDVLGDSAKQALTRIQLSHIGG
jgi:hypothetical protein